MANQLTVEDIVPLVATLAADERARLVRLVGSMEDADSLAYAASPPSRDEFSMDEEPLAWDGEGWEDVG